MHRNSDDACEGEELLACANAVTIGADERDVAHAMTQGEARREFRNRRRLADAGRSDDRKDSALFQEFVVDHRQPAHEQRRRNAPQVVHGFQSGHFVGELTRDVRCDVERDEIVQDPRPRRIASCQIVPRETRELRLEQLAHGLDLVLHPGHCRIGLRLHCGRRGARSNGALGCRLGFVRNRADRCGRCRAALAAHRIAQRSEESNLGRRHRRIVGGRPLDVRARSGRFGRSGGSFRRGRTRWTSQGLLHQGFVVVDRGHDLDTALDALVRQDDGVRALLSAHLGDGLAHRGSEETFHFHSDHSSGPATGRPPPPRGCGGFPEFRCRPAR